MDIEQNVFKLRLWKAVKIMIWTFVFIFLYQTVHFINDEEVFANWWIGIMGCLLFLTLYLIPSNKFLFRKLRWLFLMLFGFFLGWFLADLNEFLETIKFLMNNQI